MYRCNKIRYQWPVCPRKQHLLLKSEKAAKQRIRLDNNAQQQETKRFSTVRHLLRFTTHKGDAETVQVQQYSLMPQALCQ